jgi:hypothetical protein
MPSVSGPQHRAMEAAKHGKSTLGIPQSVGADFVAADKRKKFAGGGPVSTTGVNPVTYKTGGDVGSVPTMGVAASYPPPQGQRKQGPRNYGKG